MVGSFNKITLRQSLKSIHMRNARGEVAGVSDFLQHPSDTVRWPAEGEKMLVCKGDSTCLAAHADTGFHSHLNCLLYVRTNEAVQQARRNVMTTQQCRAAWLLGLFQRWCDLKGQLECNNSFSL